MKEKAIRKGLTKSDLCRLEEELSCKEIAKKFEDDWNTKANLYIHKGKTTDPFKYHPEISNDNEENVKFKVNTETLKVSGPSLFVSLAKIAIDCNFMGVIFLEVLISILKVAGPMYLE